MATDQGSFSPSTPSTPSAPSAAASVNRHPPSLLPDHYMLRRTSLPLAAVRELSPTGSSFTPRRVNSFSRPGSLRRRPSVHRDVENLHTLRTVEVRLPAFENVVVDRSQLGPSNESDSSHINSNGELQEYPSQLVVEPQPYEMAKTLVISATGQCSSKPDLPAEERESDDDESSQGTNDYRYFGQDSNFVPGYANGDHSGPSFFGPFGNLFHCWKLRFIRSFSKLLDHSAGPVHYWLKTRVSDKKINVDKDVLSTYHESFLYGKLSFSTRVRAGLRGSLLGRILLVLESIAGLLLLGLYIRTTYTDHTERWITNVQFCCSSFFMLDYLIKLYSAPVRLYYALSLKGIIDFISVLPVFFILSGVMDDAAIPQVFLVFRVLRAVPLLSSWALPGGAVGQEIFMLATYSIGVFVLAAGVLQWVEWRATPVSQRVSSNCSAHGCMSFYDAFYFVIVTVSTVGYGDVTLKSHWGRVISILIIVAAVILIPVEVNKILDLASRRPYGGNFTVQKVLGSRLIIISGNLTYRAVEDFLSEFYHPSHAKDMRAFPLRMIIMAPFKPSFEMKVLLTEYKGRVEFIEGTPLKDSDLQRVSANIASAFFLMADHLAEDPDAEDAAQIMRALSVHRYCSSKVRLIVEMLKPENQDNPIWDDADGGIEIVCPEAICYQLLARSCQIKGLSTLVINLFKAGLQVENPIPCNWMQKYCHGQQQEIYPVILPACFHEHELTFEEVVEIIYLKFEIILFGLDIVMNDGIREVILFPKQRLIQRTDIGLVIADDLSAAEKISKICVNCMPPWYIKLYKKMFNRNFKTTYERDDFLIHTVMKKRDGSYRYNDGLDSLGSGNRRDSRMKHGNESFGMMSAGHRADIQTQLREIVLASNLHEVSPKPASHFLNKAAKHEEQTTEEHQVYSLQEAVDLITMWPPLKPEKPDFPVFEKRAIEILNCLDERTLTIVNLTKPHILLCIQRSWPSNIFCFIAHLRTPSLPNPPIVILHPCRPSVAEWGCVGMFKDVYFVRGSPHHEIDLIRAGALQAAKVVILSPRGTNNADRGLNADDRSLSPSSVKIDMENVLITATVERVLHPFKGRVIVEVHQETQIHYLRPKLRINPYRFDKNLYNRNRSATFLFAPAFVEGKGFCSASLTFLLYTLFFNRNTVAITEKLISGGDVLESDDGSERLVGSRLDQVIMPKAYEGRTFGEMFVGLLRDQQWLSIGLYRAASRNSLVSFVYTNPPASEILLPGDLVYVLCT